MTKIAIMGKYYETKEGAIEELERMHNLIGGEKYEIIEATNGFIVVNPNQLK